MEKLHSVDDAFRRQLESVQAAHQAEFLRLANEKQQKIEQANQKVNVSTSFNSFLRNRFCLNREKADLLCA